MTPWLPKAVDFPRQLKALPILTETAAFPALQALSLHNLDFVQMGALDRRLQKFRQTADDTYQSKTFRLAVLSASTMDAMLPALRVAALRCGLLLDVYLGPFNQVRQEILNLDSGLYAFKPDAVLIALEPDQAITPLSLSASAAQAMTAVDARVAEWVSLWKQLKQKSVTVLQQNLVIPSDRLFGHWDSRVPGSPTWQCSAINEALIQAALDHSVLIVDVDGLAADVGRQAWCDPTLWFHSKQAISPAYSPAYGESIAKILAALRGLSKKCLALDLDNTLWGGVVGEDGVEGIEVGQGTGVGEAFAHFQFYLKHLRERGVLLCVCSKNDESVALTPFQNHPDMVLRREDFAVFNANWQDKAANLKAIAETLRIGLDSIVFFDDNPAERALIRQLLPEVAVPEVPEDPAYFVRALSNAGYFETVAFTEDDTRRAEQYGAATQVTTAQIHGNDLSSFLRNLEMRLEAAPFDKTGLPRIAQLVNKSNQFNLTTRRYSEQQLEAIAARGDATFQIRLRDRWADHGMISVVIAQRSQEEGAFAWAIDTWLMSCRVMGREVEREVLNGIASAAKRAGARWLVGEYVPTPKNDLVRDHYAKLGFEPAGEQRWRLSLNDFIPSPTVIQAEWRSKENAQ